MLHSAETWVMTGREQDILKRCDWRMWRYMAGVKYQDKASRGETVKRCNLKEIQRKTRKRGLYWLGHVKSKTGHRVLRMVEEIEVSEGD